MYTFAEMFDVTTASSIETRLKDHNASESPTVQNDNTSNNPSEGAQKQLESKYCAPMQDISSPTKAEKSEGTLSFHDLGVTFGSFHVKSTQKNPYPHRFERNLRQHRPGIKTTPPLTHMKL